MSAQIGVERCGSAALRPQDEEIWRGDRPHTWRRQSWFNPGLPSDLCQHDGIPICQDSFKRKLPISLIRIDWRPARKPGHAGERIGRIVGSNIRAPHTKRI